MFFPGKGGGGEYYFLYRAINIQLQKYWSWPVELRVLLRFYILRKIKNYSQFVETRWPSIKDYFGYFISPGRFSCEKNKLSSGIVFSFPYHFPLFSFFPLSLSLFTLLFRRSFLSRHHGANRLFHPLNPSLLASIRRNANDVTNSEIRENTRENSDLFQLEYHILRRYFSNYFSIALPLSRHHDHIPCLMASSNYLGSTAPPFFKEQPAHEMTRVAEQHLHSKRRQHMYTDSCTWEPFQNNWHIHVCVWTTKKQTEAGEKADLTLSKS